MEQYLIDTNVVSDYFSASLPPGGLKFMDSVFKKATTIRKSSVAFLLLIGLIDVVAPASFSPGKFPLHGKHFPKTLQIVAFHAEREIKQR